MNDRERTLTGRFEAIVTQPDASIALDEAAVVIAACADQSVDIDEELRHLDELASACREHTVEGLARLFFEDLNFTGNRRAYYDPRNSFLPSVLARRTGIPITLCVAFMEVGRRVGVQLAGVGMPGHFLLRDEADPAVFIDVFGGGTRLDAGGCEQLFRSLHGESAPFFAHYLAPVPRAAIIARILANLRSIYASSKAYHSLCWVARLRALLPEADADIWREYAAVATSVDRVGEAIDACRRVVESTGGAEADRRAYVSALASLN